MPRKKSVYIPKSEIVWKQMFMADGQLKFVITSTSLRDFYFLYEVLEDGTVKKLGKDASPLELEAKYNVDKIIGVTNE